MKHEDDFYTRWYILALAGLFIVLCGISSLRYVWIDLFGGASVPLWTQLLCFGLTASSIVYLTRPRLGHRLLLAVTLLVLVLEGPAGPPAAAFFWFAVLALLLLPWANVLLQTPRITGCKLAGHPRDGE